MTGDEFVEGWIIAQVLGEGSFGEVRLLINRTSGEAVALKSTSSGSNDNGINARKEAQIHRSLRHPNIVHCFGARSHGDLQYMFLEYCTGGELFDQIEPDVGMADSKAQRYFTQLLSGIGYLHSRGVAHRDIKPENILLDDTDNIKISDFGMATMFRMRGMERLLNRRCGTLPYCAPEILALEVSAGSENGSVLGGDSNRGYHAAPADLWSCGIVLVALLAGELPWERASKTCVDYSLWASGKGGEWTSRRPWSKLSAGALALLRKLLSPHPDRRPVATALLSHRFLIAAAASIDRRSGDVSVCLSQPLPGADWQPETDFRAEAELQDAPILCFSQPAHPDDLFLATQFNTTQSTQNVFQKLVRRMTRFFVNTDCSKAIERLCTILDDLKYQWKQTHPRLITITTLDCRKMQLIFKANFLEMDGKVLLDFRLSKGCGLEFKRRFVNLKSGLGDLVVKGPVTWPVALATSSIS